MAFQGEYQNRVEEQHAMRSDVAITLLVWLACGAIGSPTHGREPYFAAFKEKYAPDAESEYGKLVTVTRCNVCHADKMPKSKRNVYGIALSKVIAKNEKNKANMDAALGKIEGEKSPSGKTFGELIKEGKLPGA
jgi:hypothetical protein